jgi:hypothetical protein
VPVVHAIPARVWAIQHRLHVHQPVKGFGRLLADLPPPRPRDRRPASDRASA